MGSLLEVKSLGAPVRGLPEPPVVLITGGSCGIGAACVRRFLKAGWRVSVLALPDTNLRWLKSLGVVVTAGDVTSEQTREAAVHSTVSAYGRIDALINNAGVGLYALPTDVPSKLFLRLLDVNAVAPLALAQLVIPFMQDQGCGAIVTIGSVAGNVSLPWASAYSASKFAIHAVHDSLRLEWRRSAIHFMKVCPGVVDTDFRANVLAGQPPDRVREFHPGVSADAIADGIFRGMMQRRKTVYLPAIGFVFSLCGRLAPKLMDFYLSRFLRSKHPLTAATCQKIVSYDENQPAGH